MKAEQTHIPEVLSGALAGTSAMTLYSYVLSSKKNKQFREPELLAILLKRLFPESKKSTTQMEGWILHYGVGLLFTAVYDRIWRKTKGPSLPSSLLLGAISGLIGIGVWKKTFDLHPDPPSIHFKKYYGHLFVAHLVFGAFTALGYRISNNASRLKLSKGVLTGGIVPTNITDQPRGQNPDLEVTR
jgi:hypothetical protein